MLGKYFVVMTVCHTSGNVHPIFINRHEYKKKVCNHTKFIISKFSQVSKLSVCPSIGIWDNFIFKLQAFLSNARNARSKKIFFKFLSRESLPSIFLVKKYSYTNQVIRSLENEFAIRWYKSITMLSLQLFRSLREEKVSLLSIYIK